MNLIHFITKIMRMLLISISGIICICVLISDNPNKIDETTLTVTIGQ